jgi:hypothetical protein
MRLRSRDLFQTARTEGGLLPADLLARVADGDGDLGGLRPTDYHLAAGERLGERINRSWTRLAGAWLGFDQARATLPPGDSGARLTRERWLHVLFDELGYGRLVQQPAIEIEGKAFPVFSQWQHTPIHLVGCGTPIDTRTKGVRGATGQSPHSLLQELLNRSPERLWGILSNGLVLRLLRDNVALTRQAYLEFDLEAMFTGEVYADFVLLWLVCHQSRVEAERPENCWLERWTRTASHDGTRALDALRQGVQEAIETLGAGFLVHPSNHDLHQALRDGNLDGPQYYRALLRVVYRLLFLFVAEDRDALLDPHAPQLARERYLTHYSTRQIRALAAHRRGGRQHDRYEQLKLVMAALDQDGCTPLALPALGSYLWSREAIGLLADAKLANDDLLDAVRSLSTVDAGGVRRTVDFRNLGAEELGSVYESLLELHPTLDRATATFTLDAVTGSERKTTGSYYTPASLISSLLDTALDPVLDEADLREDPEAAILSLAVVDPACGSGHFLIAAAGRIAKRLAAIRSHDPEPSPVELRVALRDVVGRCLHAVDVNPMAVELCKVALWMEALEPGRPLSFLDHRIVLGDALLGATPELIAAGIPPDAFKPILGDDKKLVTALRRRNEQELSGQTLFDIAGATVDADTHALAEQATAIAAVDDQSLAGIREQQRRFEQLLGSQELRRAALAADVWCTAFVAEKHSGAPLFTQDVLARALASGANGLSREEQAAVAAARERYRFLHWHVAFPAVWERGGFDVVLGNPPWDQIQLDDREFFAHTAPAIASAPNMAARKRMIDGLEADDPALWEAYLDARHTMDAVQHFVHSSGRFPLSSRGRLNTAPLFTELVRGVVSRNGRIGLIVPTGIATDSFTQYLFQDLVGSQSLVSLFDFENRENLFPGVGHGRMKFCLLTLAGSARPVRSGAQFIFFATRAEHLDDPDRRFTLTGEEIALLNPNTRTCPVFRSRRDAELTKGVYRRVPVLVREGQPDGNPWGFRGLLMFMMNTASHLFQTGEQLEAKGFELEGNVFKRGGERWMPLYEAKMIHHFDHRFGDYAMRQLGSKDTQLPDVPIDMLNDPDYVPMPRYWVAEPEVEARLAHWGHGWLLGWRDITNSTNERTLIAGVFPRVAAGNNLPVAVLTEVDAVSLLVACISSFALDYITRFKAGGTHLNFFITEQLPVLPPDRTRDAFMTPRVLELSYTAADLAAFARDLGYEGPPFVWDPDRRALIRAELDALMFRLYGIERDDAEYVLETFPIVKRNDERRFGEYRTKRLILERYDAMGAAEAAGLPYETPLAPPPGDPAAAHPSPAPTATI